MMSSIDPSTPRTPKNQPFPLITLLSANAISLSGSSLTLIAIPWFVLQTTGSATQVGLTALAEVLAFIIAGFLGGALVDRLGPVRMSIGADLASALAVAAIPLLYYTVGLAFWQLLLFVFLANFFNAPGNAARKALQPELANLGGVPLERANGLREAIQRGSRLIGAPLGGICIAIFGTERVLWIDAATFLVSALLVASVLLRYPLASSKKAARPESGGYLAELGAGLRFMRQDSVMRTLVPIILLINFLDAPIGSIILPVYARQAFGSALVLGLLEAAFASGALGGNLLYSLFGHRLPRRSTFIVALIGTGLPYWLLTLQPGLPLVLTALVLVGIASSPLNPLFWTLAQERVPAEMRGRVFATITACAFAAVPLGLILGGPIIDRFGIQLPLIAIAGCYLLITTSTLINPALHALNAAPEQLKTTSDTRLKA